MCTYVHCQMSRGAARCPRWPHTSQREGTLWSCCHITRSRRSNNYKATIARTAGSRRAWLGRGDWGWATTELRLNNSNMTTAPGQVQASGEQQWRQRWAATGMRMQGQTNCVLDEPPEPGEQRDDCDRAATASARQTSAVFAARRNRTPLKGVAISQSLYSLTPQFGRPAPLLLRVGVAHKTTNTLGLQMMHGVDLSPYRE